MNKLLLNSGIFNEAQIEQIELGLHANLQVDLYANPDYSWEHMYHVRHCLSQGFDPRPLLNSRLTKEQANVIVLAIMGDHPTETLLKVMDPIYNEHILRLRLEAIRFGCDADTIIAFGDDTKALEEHMWEVRLNKKKG